MEPDALLDRAASALRSAERILILTGAGVSAASGVPTFRGAPPAAPGAEAPLWSRFRPEELATPGAFRRDPVLVWRWYAWRRGLVRGCAPNPAHDAIARLCLLRGARLVSQNVDGLHARAAREAAEALGVDARAAYPLDLHGSLFGVRCTRCGIEEERPEPLAIAADDAGEDDLPSCEACGGLLRPAVVWFGEALPEAVLEESFALAALGPLCLVVGTSGAVQPAASLPFVAMDRGGRAIEVNPEPTPLTPHATVHLRGPADGLLPALVARVLA